VNAKICHFTNSVMPVLTVNNLNANRVSTLLPLKKVDTARLALNVQLDRKN